MTAQLRYRTFYSNLLAVFNSKDSSARAMSLVSGLDGIVDAFSPTMPTDWNGVARDSMRLLNVWVACDRADVDVATVVVGQIRELLDELSGQTTECPSLVVSEYVGHATVSVSVQAMDLAVTASTRTYETRSVEAVEDVATSVAPAPEARNAESDEDSEEETVRVNKAMEDFNARKAAKKTKEEAARAIQKMEAAEAVKKAEAAKKAEAEAEAEAERAATVKASSKAAAKAAAAAEKAAAESKAAAETEIKAAKAAAEAKAAAAKKEEEEEEVDGDGDGDEDEDEDENENIEEFSYRQRTYYKDKVTQKVYTIDEDDSVGDEIGVYDGKKIKFLASA